MRRTRALLVFFAVLAAGAAGAVTYRALRAAAPPSSGPELAMPAPPKISEQPEQSSLGMVKRGDEPPSPKPVIPPSVPQKPAPKPPPANVPENEPDLKVAGAPPPAKPGLKPKRAPKLKPLPQWQHLLGDDVDDAGNPVVHYLQKNEPPKDEPKVQEQPKPAPQVAKKEERAPAPESPPQPPPRRGWRPPPPPADPAQRGPSTQVSAAPPPPPLPPVDAPLPPPQQSQSEVVNVTFVTRGASDTPPPPNPVAPNGTASACVKPGSFRNTWTGVCYDTRDLCQQAQPNGQCVPGPTGPKKATFK